MAKQTVKCCYDGCTHSNGLAHVYALNRVEANRRLGNDRGANMTWTVRSKSALCPPHARAYEARYGFSLVTVQAACTKEGIKIPHVGSTTNGRGDRSSHRRRVA